MKKLLTSVSLLVVFSLTAAAGAITVDAGWYGFCFGGVGSGITAGCQNSGIGAVGNPVTFTAAGPVTFRITDAFSYGDQFTVNIDSGANIFTTNAVATLTGSQSNPDLAWLDPGYSHGLAYLGAGAHTINVTVAASPFGSGGAYLEVISGVPEPSTFVLIGAGLAAAFAARRRRAA